MVRPTQSVVTLSRRSSDSLSNGRTACRPTDFRSTGDHYEAMINGKWLEVLADKVIHRSENPTGRAVVCWTPVHGILCFIPGPEA